MTPTNPSPPGKPPAKVAEPCDRLTEQPPPLKSDGFAWMLFYI